MIHHGRHNIVQITNGFSCVSNVIIAKKY